MKFIFIRDNCCRGLLIAFLFLLGGCGGGTTGTSSTGELKLAGYIQDASGARITFEPMLVRSGATDTPLLGASTDAQGDFIMSLPGNESSVKIEIAGNSSSPLARNYLGSSLLSTIVTRDLQGEIQLSGSFELRIDPDTLCSSYALEDNALLQKGEIVTPCFVRTLVSSSDYPTSSFKAVLDARCGSEIVTVSTSVADSEGAIDVDLAAAASEGCAPNRLVISSELDGSRSFEIPFN